MGRPMERPGKPVRNFVTVRVSDDMLAHLDEIRGPRSRAAYIRHAIRLAAKVEKK